MLAAVNLQNHQNALLMAGRCPRCAETVSRVAIVREGSCAHCGTQLLWTGQGELGDALEAKRNVWRVAGYVLVAGASALAGSVPLLQFVVQIAALFILHVLLLRRELAWLPAGRRVLARLTIKLLGAAIACVALLINVAVAPFLGLSIGVLGLAAPLLTAVYVEGGLAIVRRRLRWERERRGLQTMEWALPVAMLAGLVVAVAATVGVVGGTLHLLANAEMPTISDIATRLTELAP